MYSSTQILQVNCYYIPQYLLWLVQIEFYLLQLHTDVQDVIGFQFQLNIVKLVDEHFLAAQIVSLCTKVKKENVLINNIPLLTSVLYSCMYSCGVESSLSWNISDAGRSILSPRSRWSLAEFSTLSMTSKWVPLTIKPSSNCPVSFKCSPTLSSCNKRLCNYILILYSLM